MLLSMTCRIFTCLKGEMYLHYVLIGEQPGVMQARGRRVASKRRSLPTAPSRENFEL